MSNISEILSISVYTFISWVATTGYLLYFNNKVDKLKFIGGYYIWHIVANIVVFYLFYKVNNRSLSPFAVTGVSMMAYFFVYYFVYKFLYRGELWFLNYADFIIPVFIMATVIYFLGVYIRG